MSGNELHVQAGVWNNHGGRRAALFMEGEAPDRTNGGGLLPDAFYRVVLARGFRLTTDLEHLDLRPMHGWSMCVDPDGYLTLSWPQPHPLLEHVPLDLPDGWLGRADEDGFVVVFAGYTLGMHEHTQDGASHPVLRLEQAAETGALASGVVALAGAPGLPG